MDDFPLHSNSVCLVERNQNSTLRQTENERCNAFLSLKTGYLFGDYDTNILHLGNKTTPNE
jgi:hypothetical protein